MSSLSVVSSSLIDKSGSCESAIPVEIYSRRRRCRLRLLVRCGRCSVCRRSKRSWFYHRAMRGLSSAGGSRWLLTATFKRAVGAQEASRCWNIFRTRLAKEVAELGLGRLRYIKVLQLTKRGRIHYHALLVFEGRVRRREIAKLWTRINGAAGFIHLQVVKGEGKQAARYCARYLGREVDQVIAGARMWSCSRGFGGIKWTSQEYRRSQKERCTVIIPHAVAWSSERTTSSRLVSSSVRPGWYTGRGHGSLRPSSPAANMSRSRRRARSPDGQGLSRDGPSQRKNSEQGPLDGLLEALSNGCARQ